MKCVKNVDGEIRRVRDGQAETYVKSGGWKYIPKSEWKAARVAATEKKATEKKAAKESKNQKKKHQPQKHKSGRSNG